MKIAVILATVGDRLTVTMVHRH